MNKMSVDSPMNDCKMNIYKTHTQIRILEHNSCPRYFPTSLLSHQPVLPSNGNHPVFNDT